MVNPLIKKLILAMIIIYPLAFLFLAGILMLTAGTLSYWQGWVFCALIFSFSLFFSFYFIRRDPEFLERRMKYKEKEMKQKSIIKLSGLLFFIGFLVPGFDYRYGWSDIPFWLVIISDVVIFLGYVVVFLAFKENSYAGRTVEVFKGQKVIDTGPYSIVRHPMYSGVVPMFLCMAPSLGSYWALLFFAPIIPIIILRILNEEEVLKRDLPGYVDYCKKVQYRLIPLVW